MSGATGGERRRGVFTYGSLTESAGGATIPSGGRSAQETVHLPLVEVATSTVGESPSTSHAQPNLRSLRCVPAARALQPVSASGAFARPGEASPAPCAATTHPRHAAHAGSTGQLSKSRRHHRRGR